MSRGSKQENISMDRLKPARIPHDFSPRRVLHNKAPQPLPYLSNHTLPTTESQYPQTPGYIYISSPPNSQNYPEMTSDDDLAFPEFL